MDKEIYESLRDEAKLLAELGRSQHDHIVRLLGVCSQNGKHMCYQLKNRRSM
jgi:hypothetical protein